MVAGLEMNNDQVLAVNTALGINSFEDLRGKPIAVDAPDAGFSFPVSYTHLTLPTTPYV